MRVQVTGSGDLFRLAHALNEARQTGLKRELDKGSREAGKVIADAVTDRTSTARYIPRGFETRWDQYMEAKVEVRLVASRRITAVFYGRGKRHRRDIRRINAGELRHPVYGRTRRLKAGGKYVRDGNRDRITGGRYTNPWVGQKIRPGLVDEPAMRVMPKAVKKIDDAMGRVAAKIERAG